MGRQDLTAGEVKRLEKMPKRVAYAQLLCSGKGIPHEAYLEVTPHIVREEPCLASEP